MSTYIDLNSVNRDRNTYPNPHSYTVTTTDEVSWGKLIRSVSAYSPNTNTSVSNYSFSISLSSLIIPYTTALAAQPRIYLSFYSNNATPNNLILSLDNTHISDTFVCDLVRVQTDNGGTPVWLHYASNMTQVMSFANKGEITFKLTTIDGTVLPSNDTTVPTAADATKQTHATFQFTPYIRDGTFDNHTVGLRTY